LYFSSIIRSNKSNDIINQYILTISMG
jgi:hypothetical protein